MRLFPPIVTGPIIIAIGLTLSTPRSPTAPPTGSIAARRHRHRGHRLQHLGQRAWSRSSPSCSVWSGPLLRLIICRRRHAAMTPRLSRLSDAAWIGAALHGERHRVLPVRQRRPRRRSVSLTSVVTIVPARPRHAWSSISATSAPSPTCERNYPGRSRPAPHAPGRRSCRPLLAALFGASGQHHLRREHRRRSPCPACMTLPSSALPRCLRSSCPSARSSAALVSAMPTATIGGVSMVLYGMISAVGVRNVVENKVDFTNSRNVIIAAHHPRPRHRHQLHRRRPSRIGDRQPLRPRRRRHRRHRAQRRPARQGLRVRAGRQGFHLCGLQSVMFPPLLI